MNLHEARTLANELLLKFHLSDWRFKFDRSVKRFGQCDYRTKTISLSRHLTLINSQEHIEDTIRHEIAHAMAGQHAGHGRQWKMMAINCGAKPERCYDAQAVKGVDRKWIGTCPKCGLQVKKHRRTKTACRVCCQGEYNTKFLFIWTRIRKES